jgi:hypothetical protein
MTTIRECVYRTAVRTGCAVAFSAVLAVGLGAPPARAQTSHDSDRYATGIDHLTRSTSYNGYTDGFARSAEYLKSGAVFVVLIDLTFLRAESGYTPDMGPFADYQSAFRRAYTRGYSDAHYGRDHDPAMNVSPASPEPGALNEGDGPRTDALGGDSPGVASANGYDAGYEQGAGDSRRGASYAYRENEIYRAATDGYNPALGDETRYQVVFRQTYARGYSDGFNGRAYYTETAVEAHGRGDRRDHPRAADDSRRRRTVDSNPAVRQAADSGYRNGHERWQYNHQIGARNPNPQDHGAYQFALDGWESKLSDRSAFQQETWWGVAAGSASRATAPGTVCPIVLWTDLDHPTRAGREIRDASLRPNGAPAIWNGRLACYRACRETPAESSFLL